MTNRPPKPTDDQIEADILAKRDDPAAWEALPLVPPASSRRPDWAIREKHLQLAAKFHVLSVLHFHGVEANLALCQPEDVDVMVFNRAGQALTIDVKTMTRDSAWSVDAFTARKHHFIVFVDYAQAAGRETTVPTVYVAASEALRQYVAEQHISRITLSELNAALRIRNAWQSVLTDAA